MKVAIPVAFVAADVLSSVPWINVVSIDTVRPAIGLPWPSCSVAVTVAVPPG